MDFPLAWQRFYQAIQSPEANIDLATAALYLAQEEYPDLDPTTYLHTLDRMAMAVEARLPRERYPLKVIQTINQYLYEDLGFIGNRSDYYDPRNSFLNQVIERRTGIPITLSLVYLEIAQRINFPMAGVGMPGHFLIRPTLADMEVFVDPFNRGEILFAEDCQERLSQLYGSMIQFQPELLETISARHFLARMLNNLKLIYLSQEDMPKALAAIERILLLFPDAPIHLRDRGLIYYHIGLWVEARRDLETYLAETPTSKDASVIMELLEQMGEDRREL
ncbi:MAG: tetratricopeptide repeat protein [Cyanothece sp. SIO1E1]|nr:tetratricopeptide repeat protein [Cyanothece sp. SIO1E1]